MTHQDIIKMLEQEWQDRLEAAVKQEREACAKICDTTPPEPFRPSIEAAYAIRARGAKQ